MIDLEECIKRGLIRKNPASKEQAIASIRKAKLLLEEAKADLTDKRYTSAALLAYLVLLTSSRALLFRDGYRERSHACVARYIESRYGNKLPKEYIELLDHYRETRHGIQYDADYLTEDHEAKQIVEFASKFLEKISGLIV